MDIDPTLDLVLERVVDMPPELVWRAWTEPAHLKAWFCPRPWRVTDCDIDLRPGGIFRTVMQGPEGPAMDSAGCYLEVVPNRRLVWTSALEAGYRPSREIGSAPFVFTGVLLLDPSGAGTRYRAIVKHATAEARAQHDAMGFTAGWGAALDQLVEHAKRVM